MRAGASRPLALALALAFAWALAERAPDDGLTKALLADVDADAAAEEVQLADASRKAKGVRGLEGSDADVYPCQEGLAVPGHTRLETLKVCTLKPSEDGKCKGVLQKFARLAQEELDEDQDNGTNETATWASEYLADVGKVTGDKLLNEVEELEDHADLRDALRLGEVITISDQNTLVECAFGYPSRLDEHSTTGEGDPLVEGDMAFHGEDNASALLEAVQGRFAGQPWTNGVVSWCFSPQCSPMARHAWQEALRHITTQVPCIRFQELQAASAESCAGSPAILVQSVPQEGCWSFVGQLPQPAQKLNLGRGCETMAIAAHEIAHSLGLAHEQSRPDRDKYVTVHFNNIQKGMENNFRVEPNAFAGDAYDTLSLMHYGFDDFAIHRGQPTISGKTPQMTKAMGQRMGFSESDIRALGKLYNCENQVKPLTLNTAESSKLLGGANIGGGNAPQPLPQPHPGFPVHPAGGVYRPVPAPYPVPAPGGYYRPAPAPYPVPGGFYRPVPAPFPAPPHIWVHRR